jgi:ABC-2 type transport system ATP-binding protein
MITIEAKNLTKKFGEFVAVENIELQVSEGEIFGFLGANVAGKTTTIKMLIGLLKPTSGYVFVSGIDVIKYPEKVKQNIGYMSQKFSLYGDLTVEENISFYGGIYGTSFRKLSAIREELIEKYNLYEVRKVLTKELPLGMKQRLALGIALMHKPKIVFLDEPTSGADPVSRRNFWRIIQDLGKEGVSVFVTTHYLEEAEYCSRISMIDEGKIIITGTPMELKKKVFKYPLYEIDFGSLEKNLFALNKGCNFGELVLFGSKLHLVVDKEGVTRDVIIRYFDNSLGFPPVSIREIVPTLEDVFVKIVNKKEYA